MMDETPFNPTTHPEQPGMSCDNGVGFFRAFGDLIT
jgi:hypothetical protein